MAHEFMPGLMLLRIHTDATSADGKPIIGHGETYYVPQAAAAVIHDWMAQRLLGADATACGRKSLAISVWTQYGVRRHRGGTPGALGD